MNKSRIEELFLQAEGSQDALKCLTNLLTSEASIIIAGSSEALRGVGFRKIIGSQSHQALRIIVADEQPEGMSDRWPLIRPTAELSRSVAMRAALSQDPDSVSVDVCNADSFAIYMASTETGHIGSITTLEAASAADAYKFMLECFTTRMPGKSREFATDYFAQTMPWILEVGEVAGKPTFSGLYRIRADGIEATFKLTQDKKPFYELSHEEIDPRTSWGDSQRSGS